MFFALFFMFFSVFLDSIHDSMFFEKVTFFILSVIQNMKMLYFMRKATFLFSQQHTCLFLSFFTQICYFSFIELIYNFQNSRLFDSFLNPAFNCKYYKKHENLSNSNLSDIYQQNMIHKNALLVHKTMKKQRSCYCKNINQCFCTNIFICNVNKHHKITKKVQFFVFYVL